MAQVSTGVVGHCCCIAEVEHCIVAAGMILQEQTAAVEEQRSCTEVEGQG